MSPAARLRALLERPGALVIPGVHDAISARRAEAAGFEAAFMSGYTVSAARLGLPDAGLISYGEIVDQGRNICQATHLPVLGDADTGYGNAVNVRRTLAGYAQAGFACAMIEDQVWPKRCGHTAGKAVVPRVEALARVRAAADARRELGLDICIMARTDARATHGLDEAIARAAGFAELGVDILFVEAPENEAEMARLCRELPGPKLVNVVEGGKTPLLPAEAYAALGYKIALYPVTLLSASIAAMDRALARLRDGEAADNLLADFPTLCNAVGFDDYFALEARYAAE